jgi:hypothetical protein
MRNLDHDAKMIADIRVLSSKVEDLYNGVNALRKRYPDQDLIKYGEIDNLKDASEKLRQINVWLQVMADALSDRAKAA